MTLRLAPLTLEKAKRVQCVRLVSFFLLPSSVFRNFPFPFPERAGAKLVQINRGYQQSSNQSFCFHPRCARGKEESGMQSFKSLSVSQAMRFNGLTGLNRLNRLNVRLGLPTLPTTYTPTLLTPPELDLHDLSTHPTSSSISSFLPYNLLSGCSGSCGSSLATVLSLPVTPRARVADYGGRPA